MHRCYLISALASTPYSRNCRIVSVSMRGPLAGLDHIFSINSRHQVKDQHWLYWGSGNSWTMSQRHIMYTHNTQMSALLTITKWLCETPKFHWLGPTRKNYNWIRQRLNIIDLDWIQSQFEENSDLDLNLYIKADIVRPINVVRDTWGLLGHIITWSW